MSSRSFRLRTRSSISSVVTVSGGVIRSLYRPRSAQVCTLFRT